MTDDMTTEIETAAEADADFGPTTDEAPNTALWTGDTGVVGEQSRRALLELIKGPYLSGVKAPALSSALLAPGAPFP